MRAPSGSDPHLHDSTSSGPIAASDNRDRIIVTSSDDNYALYAGVMLASIKNTIGIKHTYDVFILDDGISATHRDKIKLLSDSKFRISFLDISPYLSRHDANIFQASQRFPRAACARLFIPEMFKNTPKVLYLDPDMIVCDDLGRLFETEFDGELLAACIDIEAVRSYQQDIKFKTYIDTQLKLRNGQTYFQSGLMLFNIPELIAYDFTHKCLMELAQTSALKYPDQCMLNKICEGRVKLLNSRWNILWFVFHQNNFILNSFDSITRAAILNDAADPGILHFCGTQKPWKDVDNKFSELFWQCARSTPFYEEILFKSSNLIHEATPQRKATFLKRIKNKIRFYRYTVLSNITFGKTRARYKQKRDKQYSLWLNLETT